MSFSAASVQYVFSCTRLQFFFLKSLSMSAKRRLKMLFLTNCSSNAKGINVSDTVSPLDIAKNLKPRRFHHGP